MMYGMESDVYRDSREVREAELGLWAVVRASTDRAQTLRCSLILRGTCIEQG
jgi:hypothetical protein